jgi:hypothetical protein
LDQTNLIEMQFNNKNLISLALCAIFIYLNLGAVISILDNLLKITFCYSKLPIWWYYTVDILLNFLRLAFLITLFSYLLKHLEFILNDKNLQFALLVNLIVFPVSYLINYGLAFFQFTLIPRTYGPQSYGKYAQINQIVSIASNVLNSIMMMVFGIIVLGKKQAENYNTNNQ